jgi:hypothetical protein
MRKTQMLLGQIFLTINFVGCQMLWSRDFGHSELDTVSTEFHVDTFEYRYVDCVL